jgi:hypothetical protein
MAKPIKKKTKCIKIMLCIQGKTQTKLLGDRITAVKPDKGCTCRLYQKFFQIHQEKVAIKNKVSKDINKKNKWRKTRKLKVIIAQICLFESQKCKFKL